MHDENDTISALDKIVLKENKAKVGELFKRFKDDCARIRLNINSMVMLSKHIHVYLLMHL